VNFLPTADDVETQLSEVRHAVLAEIKRVRSPKRSTHFRIARAIAVGAVGIVALTAGTLAVVRASQDQINYSVVCYEGETLTSRTVTIESPPLFDADGSPAPRVQADPVSTCENMWRMGIVGQNDSPADPNLAEFPVPNIVGCRQTNGVAAGFPRAFTSVTEEYFCARVGMTVWKD